MAYVKMLRTLLKFEMNVEKVRLSFLLCHAALNGHADAVSNIVDHRAISNFVKHLLGQHCMHYQLADTNPWWKYYCGVEQI